MPVSPHDIQLHLDRDTLIDEFGHITLRERYMLPGETSPQHAFARASAAFADDLPHAQRLYDYVSKQWFMFATPLLSNGGTERGLPISCFLTAIEDSRESISDHFDEVIWLSSTGGGIGTYYGALREKGSKTSKGSSSTGVIPFIGVDDRLILAVSQGGTRRGSEAVYLDVHHPEVREFVTIRKAGGGDSNRKALNLHNGLNITDEFLECIRTGASFPLRSPKDGAVVGFEDARELWKLILETRKQTGEPYLFQVDEANRRLPEPQRRKGLRVNHSNLCVGPMTELMTDQGYRPIGALAGQTVNVWNGIAWSPVTVKQTAESTELVRVWFEDGDYLDVTPYHKFYDAKGRELRAGELTAGVILEDANHPMVEREARGRDLYSDQAAYTAGWATLMGFEDANKLAVLVPEDAGEDTIRRLMTASVDASMQGDDALLIRYESRSIPAGRQALSWTNHERLMWLGGAMDGAGEWIEIDGVDYLSLGSTDQTLIREMRLMALELGLQPRIRLTDTISGFMLDGHDIAILVEGHCCLRHARGFEAPRGAWNLLAPMVADVQPLALPSATFCFNEAERHRGLFAGYLSGNCTEITLATGRDDQGKKRTAVCCLSSVNAETYDQWRSHPTFIEDLMRMLDNTLTVFIEKAPAGLRDAVYSAIMERSVGLGLLGFHAYLQRHMVAFESERARRINSIMFRQLRDSTEEASLKLGAERGEAPDMAGTGQRFTHKMAVAPNASSSILCGNTSPSVEPWCANVFLQKTLSGSSPQKNPNLVRALERLGLNTPFIWKAIIEAEGSIQNLDQPIPVGEDGDTLPSILEQVNFADMQAWDAIKAVFKTAPEIDQFWVIQHAIDRTHDIDQAQSINTFYPADADNDDISLHAYMALTNGVKSLYYLRSTAARRGENVNSKVERAKVDIGHANDEAQDDDDMDLGDLVASALLRPEAACAACEG